ncbi:hypothetical protein [Oceanobacillus arenosus]|uniref:hypothetical protein n=1 Tax=Oceanobacillus arenosus TaxID=1229153 RepID=UPI00147350BD|nr:hypothetical protein [Oceanobacillus arenosus]
MPLINRLERGDITDEEFTQVTQLKRHMKNQLSFHTTDVLECINKKELIEIAESEIYA